MGTSMARVRTFGHYGVLAIKFELNLEEQPDLSAYASPSKEVSETNNTWAFHKCKNKILMVPKKCFDVTLLGEKDKKKAID